MYLIRYSSRFKKSKKKLDRSGRFNIEKFKYVIEELASGHKLPEIFHDHILKGNLSGIRECHITSNLLLLYYFEYIDNDIDSLVLMDIGTHSELFGN